MLGYAELLMAVNEHMFRDKARLDLEQFKQYFMEELASETNYLETAFSIYENLACKKQNGGGKE